MSTDHSATTSDPAEWSFPTLALVWDPRTRAILTGSDRLASLSEADRSQSLAALSQRVTTLVGALDHGWLAATALFMVDDLYKSCFGEFRWSPTVGQYIAASVGPVLQELTRRGYVLHDVIDNTQPATTQLHVLANVATGFQAAGLLVTGPQLMAIRLMEQDNVQTRDVAAMARYRDEGHFLADRMIERCHHEHRHSLYLNLDLDDDTPGLSLNVALSRASAPGVIVVFRNDPPTTGSVAQIAVPPGLSLPTADSS